MNPATRMLDGGRQPWLAAELARLAAAERQI